MITLLFALLIILVLLLLFIAGVALDIYCGSRMRRPLLSRHELFSSTNQFRYFTNGRELFQDMEQVIAQARRRVWISFFIFKADETGQPLLNLLKKKAREGVDVRLLVDFFGGLKLRKEVAELSAAGVHLDYSGKPRFPFTFYYLNRRNHRKVLVVDGQTGYFGGFNVSDEYVGKDPRMGSWHDNHLRIDGTGCGLLQKIFADDWFQATGQKLDHSVLPSPVPGGDGSELALIATNACQAEALFMEKLRSAQTSIVIGSPYFVPSSDLMKLLLEQLNKGVSLTILLPMERDHLLVRPASFHYLEPLIQRGARFCQFYQGFYHSKAFVVDSNLCYLGTANFDQRSLFWNDELLGFSRDPLLIGQIMRQFTDDIENKSVFFNPKDLQKRPLNERLKTACSHPFSYFL